MLFPMIAVLLTVADGIFFGGGGGNDCCCACGTPQPASCGCQQTIQCAVAAPCPSCPQNYCPPPPVAYCPQVQPVFFSAPSAPVNAGGGGYPVNGVNIGAGAGSSYPAPSLPFPDSFPSSGGYAGRGNAGLPYNPGNIGAPTGGEVHPQQQPVAPSYLEVDELQPGGDLSSNYAPPLNKLRLPQNICEQPKVKYVVLRIKKRPGSEIEEVMEEAEEVNHPPPIEATASPIEETHDIIEEINGNEATQDVQDVTEEDNQTRARGTPTLSDAKCNSKRLRDLIIEGIIRGDALASKRNIHEMSLKRFSDSTVDVICSGTGFTYLVSTTEHCEAQKDNVICFVYKRSLHR